MGSSQQAVHTALADAIRTQAVQAGAGTPTVRGADWRQAIVDTVPGDGTVVTTDGITVRCLQSYLSPATGDRIIISVSGSGNWYAAGRTAGSSAPPMMQSGSVLMTWTTSNNPTQAVTFTTAFAVAPHVFVNIASSAAAVPRWVSRAVSITTSGFTIYLAAPDTTTTSGTNIPVQWFAVAP